ELFRRQGLPRETPDVARRVRRHAAEEPATGPGDGDGRVVAAVVLAHADRAARPDLVAVEREYVLRQRGIDPGTDHRGLREREDARAALEGVKRREPEKLGIELEHRAAALALQFATGPEAAAGRGAVQHAVGVARQAADGIGALRAAREGMEDHEVVGGIPPPDGALERAATEERRAIDEAVHVVEQRPAEGRALG